MLKPEISLPASLATATVVYGIYANALPTVADIRSVDAENRDIQAAERLASWTAAGVVSAISLIARDANIFIVGGAMVIILAWWHRHADMVDSVTGLAVPTVSRGDSTPRATEAEAPQLHSVPTAVAYDAAI